MLWFRNKPPKKFNFKLLSGGLKEQISSYHIVRNMYTNGSLYPLQTLFYYTPRKLGFIIPPQTLFYYTPRKLCLWWVYCFRVVRLCLRPSVTFCFPNILKSHQTLQTCSYMQDKYFKQKIKG